jgi:hypothetical protein
MRAIGSSAVVVSLNAFGKQSDNEETFRNNIELVNSKIGNILKERGIIYGAKNRGERMFQIIIHLFILGDIPLGIYEGKSPYFRLFTPSLLKFVANLSNIWFYIDSSSSPSIISVWK